VYVKKVAISNLRCFRHAELALNNPDGGASEGRLPNVNLLLGTNGAGKTTVLKALALGVLSPVIQNSGYVPSYLVRRTRARHGKPEPRASLETEIVLHQQDYEGDLPAAGETVRADVVPRGTLEIIEAAAPGPCYAGIYDETSPAFFVVGYGATRRVEGAENVEIASSKRRALRYHRVAGLFEEYLGLMPLARWLHSGQAARAEEVTELINSLLPQGTRFTGRLDRDGEPLFRQQGVDLPLGALSDGYRAYLGLLGDLIYHLHQSCPPRKGGKLTDLPGLVLVDDIDLHLHPSWQREVVPKIARAFPRLQFVFTTHSPLVAGTLHPENIFLTDAGRDGSSEVRQLTEPVHGLNADQVLTSSYFDLETTRAPGARRDLRRLARQAENRDPEAAIEFLRQLGKRRPAE
jgi:hypothetical protein